MHPPLARVALATGPFLAGMHLSDSMPTSRRLHTGRIFREGNTLLETGGRYDRNLSLARLGNLPFFVLGCLATFWIAAPLFGRATAIGAAAFASTSPMILAHGGLATTDMAFAATLTLALVALLRYLARPESRSAVWLGAALVLPLLTKLSAVLFLPAAGAAIVILALLGDGSGERPLATARPVHLLLVVATAFGVMWAMYRFSMGTALDVDPRLTERMGHALGQDSGLFSILTKATRLRVVPAVEWFAGVKDLLASNAEGRKGYLLGRTYLGGNPWYFTVGLLVKTPLPLLLLEMAGIGLAFSGARRTRKWILLAPAAAAIAILVTTLPTQINIGTRHVLPVFLLLTPYAGVAAVRFLASPASRRVRAMGIVLVLWYAWSTVRVHPDYLAYFNELALLSREPVLVNSDLDWGQDAKRLVRVVHDLGIDSLQVEYFGSTDLAKRGLKHFGPLPEYSPVTGWVAISISPLFLGRVFAPASDQFEWLRSRRPFTTVGRSILLYHIAPN